MAKLYIVPQADGDLSELTCSSGSDHYALVDEYPSTDDNDWVKYIGGMMDTTDLYTTPSDNSDLAGATINYVKIYIRGYFTKALKGSGSVKNTFKISGTLYYGTQLNLNEDTPTEQSESFTTNPDDSEAWEKADIDGMQIGMMGAGDAGVNDYLQRYYVEIDYDESSEFAEPTSLKADGQTNGTNLAENMQFDAQFNDGSTGESADRAKIEVSEQSDFSADFVWQPDWLTISSVSNGNRCDGIGYDGSYLSKGKTYYWRIKFKNNTTSTESPWSTESATLQGFQREWAYPDYINRALIDIDPNHAALNAGDAYSFMMKTGLKISIVKDGFYNESVQASGGWQVVYVSGKTYVVYLSQYNDSYGKLGIKIIAYDHVTKSWGDPIWIDNANTPTPAFPYLDTHHFPTITADAAGYLYVPYGCHYNRCRVRRSTNPNDPTSWTSMTELPAGSESTYHAYPQPFYVPEADRVYIMLRIGELKWGFWYTDDQGDTWSGPHIYLYYEEAGGNERVYCYGTRYDKVNNILHAAFNFNNADGDFEGIWSAYCEYDSQETVCFKIWKKKGNPDTKCGETDGEGTGVDKPINKTNAGKIIASADKMVNGEYLNQYFIEDLVLTKDGEPIVLFVQFYGQKLDVDWEEGSICAAKWNDTTHQWDITYISEELDLKNCSSRQSVCGLADRNGTLRLYTPVFAVRWLHQMPTADEGSTGTIVRSSGSDNFALLNTGVTKIDGDDNYVEISGIGSITLSSSQDSVNPDIDLSHYKILGVGVEVIARYVSTSNPTIKICADNGTTEDEGDLQTVGTNTCRRYSDFWEQDPDSNEWTPTTATTIKFRCKQTTAGKTVRLSKMIKRIYVTQAASEKHAAAELVELISTDDGDSWHYRVLSGNSSRGLPIVNCAHYLQNDQINVIYSVGREIFFLTDVDGEYDKIRADGNDIKLDCGGTEIDHTIDFSNLEETELQFQIQDAIAATDQYPKKDYHLYCNHRNESGLPKGEPDNVYLFHENFEWVKHAVSIDGQNGWTVTDGNVRGYRSPLKHGGAVSSGHGSIVSYFTDATAEKTITATSGLTDILFHGAMRCESSVNQGKLILKDNAGNSFEVGIDFDSTDRFGYGDGTTWTKVSGLTPFATQYYDFTIRVTSKGCTAWVNGIMLCEEVTSITSAKKIVLQFNLVNCYFDELNAVSDRQKSIDQTDITSGFTDAGARALGEHTPVYAVVAHARHDFAEEDSDHIYVREFTVNFELRDLVTDQSSVNVRVYVANSNTYSSENVYTYADVTVTDVSSTWKAGSITFGVNESGGNQLTLSEFTSIIISLDNTSGTDTYGQITSIELTTMQLNPIITLGTEELYQGAFYADANVVGPGTLAFYGDATVAGYALKLAESVSLQTGRRITDTSKIHALCESIIKSTGITEIEFSRGYRFISQMVINCITESKSTFKEPIETGSLSRLITDIMHEYFAKLSIKQRTVLENAQRTDLGQKILVAYLLSTATENGVNLDYNRNFTAIINSFIIGLQRLISQGSISVDFGHGTGMKYDLPIEHLQVRVQKNELPISCNGNLSLTQETPIEFHGGFQVQDHINIENLQGLSDLNKPSIVFNGLLSVSPDPVINWLNNVSASGEWFTRSLRTIRESFALYMDNLRGWISAGEISSSIVHILKAARKVPIEHSGKAKFELQSQMPISWTIDVKGKQNYTISNLTSTVIEHILSAEHLIGYKNDQHPQIDYAAELALTLGQLMAAWDARRATANTLGITPALEIACRFRHHIDNYMDLASVENIPVGWTGGTRLEALEQLPAYWSAAVARYHSPDISFGSHIEIAESRLLINYGSRVIVEGHASVEFLRTIKVVSELLTPWLAQINAYGRLQVDWVSTAKAYEAVLRLNIEYSTGLKTESKIPFSPLQHLSTQLGIPIEIIGAVYGIISHMKAQIIPPGYLGVQIITPEVTQAIINTAGLTGAQIKQAELTEVAQILSRTMIQKIGGEE
jgi:BNR repeat-containing family member